MVRCGVVWKWSGNGTRYSTGGSSRGSGVSGGEAVAGPGSEARQARGNGFSVAFSNGISFLSGIFQRIVTFPVDFHWNCPMDFHLHFQMDALCCDFWRVISCLTGVAINDHMAAGDLKDGGVMAGYVMEEARRM